MNKFKDGRLMRIVLGKKGTTPTLPDQPWLGVLADIQAFSSWLVIVWHQGHELCRSIQTDTAYQPTLRSLHSSRCNFCTQQGVYWTVTDKIKCVDVYHISVGKSYMNRVICSSLWITSRWPQWSFLVLRNTHHRETGYSDFCNKLLLVNIHSFQFNAFYQLESHCYNK